MIKELRTLRKDDRAKANYISQLLHRGTIKAYKSKAGYLAYDTEEFKEYKKKVVWGRPSKLLVDIDK